MTRSVSDAAATAAMERYAAGDDSAFAQLYALLAPRLFGYLHRLVGNQPAEDLVQQTLLRIHRARGTFTPGGDVIAWVLAIARRLAIDSLRVQHREPLLVIGAEAHRVPGQSARADDLVLARQLARRIEEEVARLPEPQRVAFDLLKRRGLSLAQAAAELRISVGALKLRLHRAHGALRAALATDLDDRTSVTRVA
jgi:RNA polymerase sigma-70 factor (ECF subfamily)